MLEEFKRYELGHLGAIKGGTDGNAMEPPPSP